MKSKGSIKSILIADDSETARMIIKQCLQIVGFHDNLFLEASNGKEALEILKNTNVDLLVTDLNMPIMDGKAILAEIQVNSCFEDISVIVITSSNNEAKEKELIGLGAVAVINKPLSPAKILKIFDSAG